jgi:preprotein translocase SecE subunit
MAQKPTKRVLKQETVRTLAEKAQSETKKPSQVRKVLKKIFSPVAFIFRPVVFILKKITPRYFKNSFNELRLVKWPNRKETRQLTTAVVLFALCLGVVVSLVDYGLDKLFKKVILKQ